MTSLREFKTYLVEWAVGISTGAAVAKFVLMVIRDL
jgi:hypothetical protein